jgi:hypothetical protein
MKRKKPSERTLVAYLFPFGPNPKAGSLLPAQSFPSLQSNRALLSRRDSLMELRDFLILRGRAAAVSKDALRSSGQIVDFPPASFRWYDEEGPARRS